VRRRLSPELLLNIREEEISWDGLFLWQFSRSGAVAWQIRGAKLNYRQSSYEEISLYRELNRNEYYADAFLYFQPETSFRLYLNGQVGLYDFQYRESQFKNSRTYAAYGALNYSRLRANEKSLSGQP